MKKRVAVLLFAILCFFEAPAQDIFEAARNGDLARMAALVVMKADTVNTKNKNGFTPLIIAGYNNQLAAVEFLLQHHANINASSPEGSVILGACYKGNLPLVEMLIANKADINAVNASGTSALMFATMAGNADLVKTLLKHAANKSIAEKSGKTALSYAQINNNKEIIALLTGE